MPDQGSQTVVVDWFADDETLDLWTRLTGYAPVRGGRPTEPDPASVGQVDGSVGLGITVDEGTPQGRTTADGIELAKILRDRPDVFQAFFTEFYGPNNDHHSPAWVDRVGGTTPEDYANYWYETYGKQGGYAGAAAQAPAESIDYDQLLRDRPDVFQASFTEYWGPNNDRHSNAWIERVGGTTPQDYARYWYKTYGKAEGYTQAGSAAQAESEPSAATAVGMVAETLADVHEQVVTQPREETKILMPDCGMDLPALRLPPADGVVLVINSATEEPLPAMRADEDPGEGPVFGPMADGGSSWFAG